jgi:hypothetical protein
MVPGATKRNALVAMAYLLGWLVGVGVADDVVTGPLKLSRPEATV